MKTQKIVLILWLFCCVQQINAYTLPQLGLGTSTFLDGGPLRQIPGWYHQNFLQVYHSNKFVDENGKRLPGIVNPNLNAITTAIQFIYLSTNKFLGGNLGCDVTLPIVLHSGIERHVPLFKSSGAGWGDLVMGAFIQWDAIMHGDRPIFIHRVEFVAAFPTGKNKLLTKTINPGSRIFFMDPYWAATLYFTPRFSASWRLHYLWCGKNPRTGIRPGQAIHFNYGIDYAFTPKFYFGIAGYYLRQLTASTLNGVKIPDSREQVFGIGPGALWVLGRRLDFEAFANIFYEVAVRNRPQGIRAIFRVLRHF